MIEHKENSNSYGEGFSQYLVQGLKRRWLLQVILAFLCVVVLKWDTINQPPVWDSAFSVFQAASELVSNGFDFQDLGQQAPYHEGGSNTHAFSLVTVVTALVFYFVSEGSIRFFILHTLHYFFASIVLVTLWRISRYTLGEGLAVMLCVVLLLQPAFATQVGFMYLEIPTLLFSILALSSWARCRFAIAAIFMFFAVFVKESGVITTVTLATVILVENKPWHSRLLWMCLMVITPLPVILFSHYFNETVSEWSFHLGFSQSWADYLVFNIKRYLLMAPDIFVAIIMTVPALIFGAKKWWKVLRSKENSSGTLDANVVAVRFNAVAGVYSLVFLAFHYLGLPHLFGYFQVLIRYHVVILPFLLVLLINTITEVFGRRTAYIVTTSVSIFFLVNHNGFFYPSFPKQFANDFSIAERSGEYRFLLDIQKEVIKKIEEIGKTVPIFYELPLHFMIKNEELGYVKQKPQYGHCIYIEEPYRSGTLQSFPPCYYVVLHSPWLGGNIASRIVKRAQFHPSYEVNVTDDIRREQFSGQIVQIKHRNASCLSESIR